MLVLAVRAQSSSFTIALFLCLLQTQRHARRSLHGDAPGSGVPPAHPHAGSTRAAPASAGAGVGLTTADATVVRAVPFSSSPGGGRAGGGGGSTGGGRAQPPPLQQPAMSRAASDFTAAVRLLAGDAGMSTSLVGTEVTADVATSTALRSSRAATPVTSADGGARVDAPKPPMALASAAAPALTVPQGTRASAAAGASGPPTINTQQGPAAAAAGTSGVTAGFSGSVGAPASSPPALPHSPSQTAAAVVAAAAAATPTVVAPVAPSTPSRPAPIAAHQAPLGAPASTAVPASPSAFASPAAGGSTPMRSPPPPPPPLPAHGAGAASVSLHSAVSPATAVAMGPPRPGLVSIGASGASPTVGGTDSSGAVAGSSGGVVAGGSSAGSDDGADDDDSGGDDGGDDDGNSEVAITMNLSTTQLSSVTVRMVRVWFCVSR